MIVGQKLMKKATAVLITMLMILNILGTNITVQAAAAPETIAAWDCTAAPASAVVSATSGALATGAELTNFKSATPTYSTTSLSINGWDNGADTKYWQISLSTKGYDSLTLSAKTRSSGTGPKDFKLVYSIDNGTTWTDVPNSTYAITATTLSNYMPTVSLPAGAADVDKLLVKFILTSNVSSGGATISNTGTSNINNITVTGTPVTNSTTVSGISAAPANGGVVAIGSKVTLACDTEGATIMYSLNNSAFAAYDPTALVTLATLPATIKAYGTKDGLTNSVTSTFNYTQGTVAAVTASPNGGAVILNKLVKLTCDTPNAIIQYSLDNKATWSDYTAPIKLTTLPATIISKATAEGLKDSAESTFDFTLKQNVNYNVYFGQLHSHTGYSDGQETPDYAYKWAKDPSKFTNNKPLDFLAITDHSNSLDNASSSSMADGSKSIEWVQGHADADANTDSSFVGIYADEMTWSNGTGHINTFNTPGFESRDTAKYKNSDGLKQYYDVLKQYPDSISQLNHPGPTFGDFNDFAYYDPQIDKVVTLIEVGNGEGAIGSNGYFPSYEYYTRALDKGWHVSPTNNQDNHLGKWGSANTARTVVLADSLNRANIYDAMRNMRTYATEDSDLKINYTLNGEVMGTIFDEKPESVNIKVDLEDPDNEALGKVSVISNGGKVVASKTLTSSKDTVEFTLDPDYSYYYIRVDEADKDIAVTAPVWLGEVDKAGISKTTGSTTLPVKGESLTITSSLFNNETVPMEVNSLEYSVEGTVINTASAIETVKSLGTGSYSFDFTPSIAGKYNVDVKLTATINGVEKIFTDVLKLSVTDPVLVTKVVADGAHFNDYVNGYYANNLGNFTAIANKETIAVNMEKTKLTDELLKDVKLLIISPPAKKSGTANGVSYQPQVFSDEDIAVVKNFVDNGGNLLVCGIADYQDGTGVFQTTTQMNKLLEGIGATSRFNNDEVIDDAHKLSNQNFRLAFDDYNMDSPYLKGVQPTQTYSFYSGCSISLDSDALASGKTTWLVKGHDTTESIDSNKNVTGVPQPKGSVYALAAEQLSGGGKMFIGGTIYISDFEVKAQLDNATQLQNSNYNIVMNILDSIKKVVPVTPISDVRSANKGDVFCVEGTVTAGKAPSDNAFFDTLYIQDATGGINLFPVSGTDIMVGQKVKATGTVDEYLGDKELRVIDYSVTDTAVNPIAPTLMTTKDSMDSINGGMLAKIEGIVTKMDSQNIYVDDGSGEARAFVDGYIGDGSEDSSKTGKWDPEIQVGDRISIVGLASVDPIGPRLRVRNTAEIVKIASSDNLDLSNLTISSGTLDPVFASDKKEYTVDLNYSVNSITVTPTAFINAATIKVNNRIVETGEASIAIKLNVGENTIKIDVISHDRKTQNTYKITVNRGEASKVADLIGLTISSGTLNPEFKTEVKSYSVDVDSNLASVTLTPTAANEYATIKINNVLVESGKASEPVILRAGTNAVRIEVIAQDGKTKDIYTVNVIKGKSNIADLKTLVISNGTLAPEFNADTNVYSTDVNFSVSSITVTPTAAYPTASIKVNNAMVASGKSSQPIKLNVGVNVIQVVVKAEDKTTENTYTLTINRGTANTNADLSNLVVSNGTIAPEFASDKLEYSTDVEYAISSMTVTPTSTNEYAVTKVNGFTVASGNASKLIKLNVGVNKIKVDVTAQDGVAKKSYIITVTRAAASKIATLSGLELNNGVLTPDFKSDVKAYTVNVDSSVVNMTVTPTVEDSTATIKVNYKAVENGKASDSIMLKAGKNVIRVEITAQDGRTKNIYSITVNRTASTSAELSNLIESSGSLVFDADKTDYEIAVDHTVNSITVTPTAADVKAVIKVNYATVKSGDASKAIKLNTGNNKITIVVVAENGTKKTYTITIVKAKSDNANLSNLKISGLAIDFDSAKTEYEINVTSSVRIIKVTPIAEDLTSKIVVNGRVVASGRYSNSIVLKTGTNTISVEVTAQDGTKKVYTITIIKA